MKKLLIAALVLGFAAPVFAEAPVAPAAAPAAAPVAKALALRRGGLLLYAVRAREGARSRA
ncbi:MAG: hypothetical protein ABL955_09550 [Elusimicrobiota bacterium]